MTLTREQALEAFIYERETGKLYWRHSRPGLNAGQLAGSLEKSGYRRINVNGRRYRRHQIIWLIEKGKLPERGIDHRDKDTGNDRIGNLRLASKQQNAANADKPSHGQSSEYKGVVWDKERSKWRAQIKVNNRCRYLGRFDDEIEAAQAYDDAAFRYYGEFARPNFATP